MRRRSKGWQNYLRQELNDLRHLQQVFVSTSSYRGSIKHPLRTHLYNPQHKFATRSRWDEVQMVSLEPDRKATKGTA